MSRKRELAGGEIAVRAQPTGVDAGRLRAFVAEARKYSGNANGNISLRKPHWVVYRATLMTVCTIDGSEYMSLCEAREFLGDLELTFRDVVREAWQRWQDVQPLLLSRPSNRLRATLMHDLMVDEVIRRLADHERVHVYEEIPGRRFLLGVRDSAGVQQALVQLKKLDDKNMVSNYPTPSAVAFNGQQPIAGVPIGMRLTLGYKLVGAATDIAVKIVFFDGEEVVWHYDLDGGASVEQLPLPASPEVRRVRAKPGVVLPGGRDVAEND